MRHLILIVSVTTLMLFCQATTHGSEADIAPVLESKRP